jgi:predicted nucleic acid-binding protein
MGLHRGAGAVPTGIARLKPLPGATTPVAKAFVQYRRSGGLKNNALGDFLIGAHAAVSGLPVLTRDIRRYEAYFPSVRLVTPP